MNYPEGRQWREQWDLLRWNMVSIWLMCYGIEYQTHWTLSIDALSPSMTNTDTLTSPQSTLHMTSHREYRLSPNTKPWDTKRERRNVIESVQSFKSGLLQIHQFQNMKISPKNNKRTYRYKIGMISSILSLSSSLTLSSDPNENAAPRFEFQIAELLAKSRKRYANLGWFRFFAICQRTPCCRMLLNFKFFILTQNNHEPWHPERKW